MKFLELLDKVRIYWNTNRHSVALLSFLGSLRPAKER